MCKAGAVGPNENISHEVILHLRLEGKEVVVDLNKVQGPVLQLLGFRLEFRL